MDSVKKAKLLGDANHMRMGAELLIGKISEAKDPEDIKQMLDMITFGLNNLRNELEMEDQASKYQRQKSEISRELNGKIRELESKLGGEVTLEKAVSKIEAFNEMVAKNLRPIGFMRNTTISWRTIKVDFSLSIDRGGIGKKFIDSEEEMAEYERKERETQDLIHSTFETSERGIIYNDKNKAALKQFIADRLEVPVTNFEISVYEYDTKVMDKVSFMVSFNNIEIKWGF